MRRKEFRIDDPKVLESFLQSQKVGTLVWSRDGQPRALPMNYAFVQGKILLHGAALGLKSELRQNTPVLFQVFKPLAYLPSNFWPENLAKNVTQFFQSVEIQGICQEIQDPEVKVQGLNALVETHQPGIPFEPVAGDQPGLLNHTALWGIWPQMTLGKFHLGQSLSPVERKRIAEKLSQRSTPLDLETLELMRTYAPF